MMKPFPFDCREQGSYFPLAAVGMGSGCCYDCRFLEPYVSRQKFALSKRELIEFLCPRSPPSSFIHSIYMLYLNSSSTPQPRPNLGGFGLKEVRVNFNLLATDPRSVELTLFLNRPSQVMVDGEDQSLMRHISRISSQR